MKVKPKPCKFCKKRVRVVEGREGRWTGLKVECTVCGHDSRIYSDRQYAIQMWNKFHNCKE